MEQLAERANLYVLIPVATVFSYLLPDSVAYGLLIALCLMVMVDTMTALSLAIKAGTVRSRTFTSGLLIKLMNYGGITLMTVALEYIIETMYFSTGGFVIRTALVGMAIGEAISIAENLAKQGVKLPAVLMSALEAVQNKVENTELPSGRVTDGK